MTSGFGESYENRILHRCMYTYKWSHTLSRKRPQHEKDSKEYTCIANVYAVQRRTIRAPYIKHILYTHIYKIYKKREIERKRVFGGV